VSFDAAGTSDDVAFTRGYDGGRPTLTTWSGAVSGSAGRHYDNDLRVDSTSVNGVLLASFLYDDDGVLTNAGPMTFTPYSATGLLAGTTLGSVSDTYSYNTFGEFASYQSISTGMSSTIR
jgi:hypothetical protein